MKIITDTSGKIVIGYEYDEGSECLISDGITTIGAMAFLACKNLTSITMPASVKKLKNLAFYNCQSLTNITISDNLEEVGNNPFKQCDNIQNVNVKSYDVYKLLRNRTSDKFRLCATISIVKNNYNKTADYTEDEIHDLKEFIIEKRIHLFPYVLNSLELYDFMFKKIEKIYSVTDIKILLEKVKTEEYSKIKIEAMAFILEYMHENSLIGEITQPDATLDAFANDEDNDLENTNNCLGK